MNQQIDQKTPIYVGYEITTQVLRDESSLLQLSGDEKTFYTSASGSNFITGVTSWNVFPTEKNPMARYKFASVQFTFNQNMNEINRKTYSLLDWLGDCGGLTDALRFIAGLIVSPFASYALAAKLMSMILRFQQSDRDLSSDSQSGINRSFVRNFDPSLPTFDSNSSKIGAPDLSKLQSLRSRVQSSWQNLDAHIKTKKDDDD